MLVAALAQERRLELVVGPRALDDFLLPVDADVDLGREAAIVVALSNSSVLRLLGALDARDHLRHVALVGVEGRDGLELREQVLIEELGRVVLDGELLGFRVKSDQVVQIVDGATIADCREHPHACIRGTFFSPRGQHDLGGEVGVVLALLFHGLRGRLCVHADAVLRLVWVVDPFQAASRPAGAGGVRHCEVVVLPLAVGHVQIKLLA